MMDWSSFESGEHDIISWLESGVVGYWAAENVRARATLWCLSHNLAIAAGLCRAFDLGRSRGIALLESDLDEPYPWRPYCQRTAT